MRRITLKYFDPVEHCWMLATLIAESVEQARHGLKESLQPLQKLDEDQGMELVTNEYVAQTLPLLLSMEPCPHSPKPARSGAW